MNTQATPVDPAAGSATLATGDVLEYDRLVFATAPAREPDIPGWGLGCFALRNADDGIACAPGANRAERAPAS